MWSISDPIIWIQAKPQSNHKISMAATILEMSYVGSEARNSYTMDKYSPF